eukprot:TRINITY_DN63528_c0_g1_i2.p1 TRINITY_DN63528_c0_g1~~TRINITY_DN63528_c0_g1_i2.p1  ORF type:complete len:128 (-),score=38.57 TRINITY_DN63528_c0_g1_i2:129-512(-)
MEEPLDLEASIRDKTDKLYQVQTAILETPRSNRKLRSVYHQICCELEQELVELLVLWKQLRTQQLRLQQILGSAEDALGDECTPSQEVMDLRRWMDDKISEIRILSPNGCSLGAHCDRAVLFRRAYR